tara:strand:+ start:83 stop:472 length:390 start_codon:yes stop_codon:yes gene_type:complete
MLLKTPVYQHNSTYKFIFMLYFRCYHQIMQKLKYVFISLFFLTLLLGCQTIKEKTDKIIEKENAKLSQFIGKSSSNLQINLGKPNEDFKNEKGNLELVYNSKKYGIPCERRFEVDSNSIVISFVSNGCF